MLARLQAASASDHPILLRTTSSAGHGMGTALDEAIDQDADMFAFLFTSWGFSTSPPRTRGRSGTLYSAHSLKVAGPNHYHYHWPAFVFGSSTGISTAMHPVMESS